MKETLHSIKVWHLLAVCIVLLPLSAFLLRQNNLKMIELRDKVVEIDSRTGDIKKVEPALKELRSYILTHMNASLATPLELPGSYNTAVEQAQKRAEQSGTANSSVYSRAQAACEDPNVLLSVRAQCIQDYVTQNAPEGTDPQKLEFPPKELFSYSYASPTWSFDLAGLSVLLTVVTGLAAVALFVYRSLKMSIKKLLDNDPLE